MALALTRRRLTAGKTGISGPNTSLTAFLQLLMIPTLITFFISGVWHGAGYVFMIWGLMHGFYITVNHGWRIIVQRVWPKSAVYKALMPYAGFIITFLCVVASMVVFRSSSVATAGNIVGGMVGSNGIEVPAAVYKLVTSLGVSTAAISANVPDYLQFKSLIIWLMAAAPVALLLPNTLQILGAHEPAIGVRPAASNFYGRNISWTPSGLWAVVVAITAFIAVFNIGGYTEFLYWQF